MGAYQVITPCCCLRRVLVAKQRLISFRESEYSNLTKTKQCQHKFYEMIISKWQHTLSVPRSTFRGLIWSPSFRAGLPSPGGLTDAIVNEPTSEYEYSSGQTSILVERDALTMKKPMEGVHREMGITWQ